MQMFGKLVFLLFLYDNIAIPLNDKNNNNSNNNNENIDYNKINQTSTDAGLSGVLGAGLAAASTSVTDTYNDVAKYLNPRAIYTSLPPKITGGQESGLDALLAPTIVTESSSPPPPPPPTHLKDNFENNAGTNGGLVGLAVANVSDHKNISSDNFNSSSGSGSGISIDGVVPKIVTIDPNSDNSNQSIDYDDEDSLLPGGGGGASLNSTMSKAPNRTSGLPKSREPKSHDVDSIATSIAKYLSSSPPPPSSSSSSSPLSPALIHDTANGLDDNKSSGSDDSGAFVDTDDRSYDQHGAPTPTDIRNSDENGYVSSSESPYSSSAALHPTTIVPATRAGPVASSPPPPSTTQQQQHQSPPTTPMPRDQIKFETVSAAADPVAQPDKSAPAIFPELVLINENEWQPFNKTLMQIRALLNNPRNQGFWSLITDPEYLHIIIVVAGAMVSVVAALAIGICKIVRKICRR